MTTDVTKMGLDDGKEVQRLMQRYYPLLLEQAAGDAEDALGIGIEFDMSNPKVLDVLDQLAKKVRGVADTTREEIRTLVGQATQEGWSMPKLATQIRALAEIKPGDNATAEEKSHARQRAETIARSESAAAYTKGSILAYQESGVVQGTQWLATGDSCEICSALDGQTADLDGTFDGEYDGPPAHPRCTCAVAPVVKGN